MRRPRWWGRPDRFEPMNSDPIPAQRATSFDCLDGQHVACIPNDSIRGSVPECSCSCHAEGDPAHRATAIAGWSPDPRPQLADDIDEGRTIPRRPDLRLVRERRNDLGPL